MDDKKSPITPDAPPDDPDQSKRFIDMAREVEADEDPEAFERALERIIQRPQKKTDQRP